MYTVVCLSVERLLHLRAPRWSDKVNSLRYGCLFVRWKSHRDNKICRIVFKQGALLGYILPVLVFSTFYNFPKFFEFTTIYPQNGWWQENESACLVRQKVAQWIHKIYGWWTFHLQIWYLIKPTSCCSDRLIQKQQSSEETQTTPCTCSPSTVWSWVSCPSPSSYGWTSPLQATSTVAQMKQKCGPFFFSNKCAFGVQIPKYGLVRSHLIRNGRSVNQMSA